MTLLANLTSNCDSIITIFPATRFSRFSFSVSMVLRLLPPLLLAVQREEAAARVITTATMDVTRRWGESPHRGPPGSPGSPGGSHFPPRFPQVLRWHTDPDATSNLFEAATRAALLGKRERQTWHWVRTSSEWDCFFWLCLLPGLLSAWWGLSGVKGGGWVVVWRCLHHFKR